MTRRLAIAILGALAALAAPAAARGDAVIDWNLQAQSTILATGPTAHASTLQGAMVHGAMYSAVNSIDRRHGPYLRIPREKRWASKDAAAATAAYRVLAHEYPTQAQVLADRYALSLAAISDGAAKTRGIAAGERAADAMLASRVDDGRLPVGTPYPFPQGTLPGEWRVSPPLTAVEPAWWMSRVRPFIISSADRFLSDGPRELTSRAYARDLNEVKALGALNSTTRTEDQTRAAIFWQAQPLAIWGGLMRDLSARYGLSTAQNARLFGKVTVGMVDATITCWNDRYTRRFWRPLDAIRLADTDGNPLTEADPGWRPLFDPSTPTTPALATPNFPDHPSGHGCVSGAAMTAMQEFFGRDKESIDIFSSRFPGQPRHFERFSDVLDEIIEARIWGGIHFRTADVQGAEIGKDIVRAQRRYFGRVSR